MDKLIYTAMSGAIHTMNQQTAVSNNLANVATAGFRAEMHKFRAVPVISDAFKSRAFVVDATVASDMSQGPLEETGKVTDMAVRGKGWFAVQLPNGTEAYTRGGSFEVNANGILQTKTGLPVVGDGGPITFPQGSDIVVGQDGVISAVPSTGGRNNTNVVGRMKLVNPPEQDLVRGEDGLFRLKSGQPAPQDEGVRMVAGYIEGSNVSVAEQMVTMISLARQFDMQTKLIQTAKENDQSAGQIISAK